MSDKVYRCPACSAELVESERTTPNNANSKQFLKANFVCPKCKLGVNRQTLDFEWFEGQHGPDRDGSPDSVVEQTRTRMDQ